MGLARRFPGVRVALASCRPGLRVGTASRHSCSQSRHSCSKSEHEKRESCGNTGGGEWEPASGEWGGKRRVGAWSGESPFKWEFVRGYGSAVVADFAHNITADFVARLGLTALLAPITALGSR